MGTGFAATFDNQSCFLDVPISVPGHFACLYEMCTVTVRMLTFKQVVCHLSNVFAYILSVATKCVYLSIIWEKKVQVWEFWWENGHVFILLLFLSFFCIMKLMFFFHGTYKCWWTWCLIGFFVFFSPSLCLLPVWFLLSVKPVKCISSILDRKKRSNADEMWTCMCCVCTGKQLHT